MCINIFKQIKMNCLNISKNIYYSLRLLQQQNLALFEHSLCIVRVDHIIIARIMIRYYLANMSNYFFKRTASMCD